MRTNNARSYRLFALVITILLSLAMVAPASATPPDFETVVLDYTGIHEAASAACGFPIEVSWAGTLKISRHVLQNGTFLEIDRPNDVTITFTKLATGKAYTSINTGPDVIRIEADGTFSSAANGIISKVTLPGHGMLAMEIGRIVFDADGNIIFEAGGHPGFLGGDVQGLCIALE
jgi:hypothetical protein